MATALGADGCVEVNGAVATGCCPPPLCGNDLCGMFCAFINILPSGPMWDFWKAKSTNYFINTGDPDVCDAVVDPHCPTLIQHAIYCVLKLRDVVHNALYPALRESNPTTAETSLDLWLERLHWEDCYKQHCRSVLLGDITPYEIPGPCGPIYCEFELPEEVSCAVKRGIVIALTRANMGVIKNLCGINWIIEPLGAQIKPKLKPTHPIAPPPNDDPCASNCDEVEFEICPTGDTLPGCLDTDTCSTNMVRPQVPAVISYGCDVPAGLPAEIWPGVIAAECIVRSLMPSTCPNNIHRCC